MDEVEGLVTALDDLGDHGASASLLHELLLGLGSASHLCVDALLLEGDGERKHKVSAVACLNELVNLREPLVTLGNKCLAGDVNKVDHGLGSEELHGVKDLNLLGLPVHSADILLVLAEHVKALLDGLVLELLFLATNLLVVQVLVAGDVGLALLNVLLAELVVDDAKVTNGVNAVLDVGHILVLESTAHVEDTIDGTNMRQESVTEASTLCSALDETGNVCDGKHSRDLAVRLVHGTEVLEALVRNRHTSDVRVDGTEREVLSGNRELGHDVKHGGLAHVGKTHDAHLDVVAGAAEKHALRRLFTFLGCHLK